MVTPESPTDDCDSSFADCDGSGHRARGRIDVTDGEAGTFDGQTDLFGSRVGGAGTTDDRRVVNRRDIDLDIVHILQGATRAGVAQVIGGDRQAIRRRAHHVGVAGVRQRSQRGVDVGHRTLDRQVTTAVAARADRGRTAERHIQYTIGHLQPRGQVAAARIGVGDGDAADGRGRLFGHCLRARYAC